MQLASAIAQWWHYLQNHQPYIHRALTELVNERLLTADERTQVLTIAWNFWQAEYALAEIPLVCEELVTAFLKGSIRFHEGDPYLGWKPQIDSKIDRFCPLADNELKLLIHLVCCRLCWLMELSQPQKYLQLIA